MRSPPSKLFRAKRSVVLLTLLATALSASGAALSQLSLLIEVSASHGQNAASCRLVLESRKSEVESQKSTARKTDAPDSKHAPAPLLLKAVSEHWDLASGFDSTLPAQTPLVAAPGWSPERAPESHAPPLFVSRDPGVPWSRGPPTHS